MQGNDFDARSQPKIQPGTGNHFVYGESGRRQPRCKEHIELDDDRGGKPRHYSGDIYVRVGERFDERGPYGDDDLPADSKQCRGPGYIDGDGNSHGVWRSAGDHNHLMPGGHTGRPMQAAQ